MLTKRLPLVFLLVGALLSAGLFAGNADAGGGRYSFDGGTPKQRAQVRSALEASAFDWDLVPARITIHIGDVGVSRALPGEIWLDASLLDTGRFAWGTVQDEFAHQVDYFLFTDEVRERLTQALGAKDWCYGVAGLRHGEYGCERFASTLVWAYWPSTDNAYKPRSKNDEAAAMAPAKFRALMTELVGAPRVVFAR